MRQLLASKTILMAAVLTALVGPSTAEVTGLREGHSLLLKLHAELTGKVRQSLLSPAVTTQQHSMKQQILGYTDTECRDQTLTVLVQQCPQGFAALVNLAASDKLNPATLSAQVPTVCQTACVNALADLSAWYLGNSSSCVYSDFVGGLCLKDGNTWCFQQLAGWLSNPDGYTAAQAQGLLCTPCGQKLVRYLSRSNRIDMKPGELGYLCAKDASGKYCVTEANLNKLDQLDLDSNAGLATACKNECQRKIIYMALDLANMTGVSKFMCVTNGAGKHCVSGEMGTMLANLSMSSCASAADKLSQVGCCANILVATVPYGNNDFNLTDYNRQVRECRLSPMAACSTQGGQAVSKSIRTNLKWSWVQSRQNQVMMAMQNDIAGALLVPPEYVSVSLSQAPASEKFATLAVDATTASVTMRGLSQAQTTEMSTSLNTLVSSGAMALPTTESLYAAGGSRTAVTAGNPPSPPTKTNAGHALTAQLSVIFVAALVAVLAAVL